MAVGLDRMGLSVYSGSAPARTWLGIMPLGSQTVGLQKFIAQAGPTHMQMAWQKDISGVAVRVVLSHTIHKIDIKV